jgi:quercetin dioxygenase-like cupin family protein
MEIKRTGSQPFDKVPADYFTGAVRIPCADPARASGASVTLEPGARTAWHSDPLGQTLIVTSGCGWAQRWAGPVEKIRPSDVVRFPPVAIQEVLNGKPIDWMEHVQRRAVSRLITRRV